MSDNQKSASSCCCSSAGDEIGTSAIVPTSRNLLELGSQNEATCPVMPGMPVNKTSAEAAGLFRDYRVGVTGSAARDADHGSTATPPTNTPAQRDKHCAAWTGFRGAKTLTRKTRTCK